MRPINRTKIDPAIQYAARDLSSDSTPPLSGPHGEPAVLSSCRVRWRAAARWGPITSAASRPKAEPTRRRARTMRQYTDSRSRLRNHSQLVYTVASRKTPLTATNSAAAHSTRRRASAMSHAI